MNGDDISQWTKVIASAFKVTCELSAWVALFSIIVAALLAMARLSTSRALRILATMEIELFRSVPILGVLIFVYYGLAHVMQHLGVSAFWLVVGSLTLIESSYLAEIYRGALEAVQDTQWDAARSLGLRRLTVLRRIIVPQAVPPSIPGTINMVTLIVKDSSLASLVGVTEATLVATLIVAENFRPLPVYILLGGFYVALILVISLLGNLVERFLSRRQNSAMPSISWRSATETFAGSRR